MYVSEWLLWQGCLKSDAWIGQHGGEDRTTNSSLPNRIHRSCLEEDRARQAEKKFSIARTRGPVYACNDTYVEMRCGGMEDKRGLITLTSLFLVCFLGGMWIDFDAPIFWAIATDGEVDGRPWDGGDLVFALLGTLLCGIPLGLYFKYVFRYTRLEAITSRHLLIRFNRITRQVYLHRPSNCGGNLVLPWQGVYSDEVVGQRLVLAWLAFDNTSLPFPTVAFVGKQGSCLPDLQSEWEFIRRYMDEGGLRAVEKPRISSQLPLPWPAFTAQFEALGPFLRNSGPLTWLGCVLISPAFVIVGLSHWASLLLCWRPRWPRIIREAGQPGKAVPAFTTVSDYPPNVQAQLLANAHRWNLRPSRAPLNSSCVGKRCG